MGEMQVLAVLLVEMWNEWVSTMALQCNVWQKKSLISQVMLKASGKVLSELKVGVAESSWR